MSAKKYVFPLDEAIRYRFPTHINDLVMDRAESDTSEAFVVVINPGEASPLHVHHDTEQVFYVLSGAGQMQIGEAQPEHYRVQAGDLVRVPAHTFHSISCEGDQALTYLAIDCFLGGRPQAEPTWDSHVQGLCAHNGWDYSKVREDK